MRCDECETHINLQESGLSVSGCRPSCRTPLYTLACDGCVGRWEREAQKRTPLCYYCRVLKRSHCTERLKIRHRPSARRGELGIWSGSTPGFTRAKTVRRRQAKAVTSSSDTANAAPPSPEGKARERTSSVSPYGEPPSPKREGKGYAEASPSGEAVSGAD